jgi:plastocyanin
LIRFWEFRKAGYLMPLAALALVGAVLVACGDDDDDDDNGTPTGAATTAVNSPAATTTTAAATATQAAATATAPAEEGVTIQVGDNFFAPDEETVAVGTEVTWEWGGNAVPHSVVGTFNGEDVESEIQDSGMFSFTFESAGTFEYECGVHGAAMSGRIVVE